MSRKTRTIGSAGMTFACIAIAVVFIPAMLQGRNSREELPSNRLVVHEWGTFTSFAGSDGVNLEFRPLVTNDLPRFIMTPYRQPGSPLRPIFDVGKNDYYALQRMETPVTYFYTDVPRTVNVRVDFPQGLLTEWFPVVKQFDSGKKKDQKGIAGSAWLDWGAVRLTPPKQFAEIIVRGPKNKPIPASLPPVTEKDHYGRARETDSAIVETVGVNGGSHFEKFLFYRGVGNFELPIKLAALGNDRFEVTNAGDDASGALILVRIKYGRIRFTRMDPVRAQASVEVSLPETESSVDGLAEAMVHELTAAGLYEKESMAMVNTWRSSWFGENGTRLLYLVPGKLTDKLLPLTVDPAPSEQVRILVGRLETLTPEDCQRIVRTLAGGSEGEKVSAKSIREELETLGRFAEPAVKFVISQTSNLSTRARLEKVLTDYRSGK